MKAKLIGLFVACFGSAVLGYLFGYQQNELNHLSRENHDYKMKEMEDK